MTRTEADQIVVYLSITYGPWSDGKKGMFAGDIEDLPHDVANQAAHEWVRGNPGNRWPAPGDIRLAVSRLIDRSKMLRLTDEREHGVPVDRDRGLKFLREMREKIGRKRAQRGDPTPLGDIIGRE